MFAQTRFSFGINVGGPRPGYYQSAPPYAARVPLSPGPDYIWVDGYWSQYGGRNNWVAGYWARRPYSYQVERRYEQPRYDNRNFVGRERGFDRDRDDHDRGRGFGNGFRR